MVSRRVAVCAAAFIYVLAAGRFAAADDWPQWRGPRRDGVWRESGIIEKFPSATIPLRWRVPVGAGYSGPTVADGRVYVTDRRTRPREIERVLCFDFATGDRLWAHSYEAPYGGVQYTAGPRAAVTIDDGRAFALGATGRLHCFQAATGDMMWQRDLRREYAIRMPVWGIAAAPLVYGDLLILQIGGSDGACLVALEKSTGEEVWRALGDRASYSAPVVTRQAGRDVLVCWTGDSVSGLDPLRGTVHWRHPFPPKEQIISISTPVIDRGRLFVTSFYDGSLMLKLQPDRLAVEQLWHRRGTSERQTDALHSIIATPYFAGDYIYGVDSYGELRCLRADTGDRVWEDLTATPKDRWSNIHMVKSGENMWMFNELGELIIGRLSPGGFEEISRAKLIEPTEEQLSRGQRGVCWAHPAFASKHVLARSDEWLVCASLAAD